jgi:hypothetical protein
VYVSRKRARLRLLAIKEMLQIKKGTNMLGIVSHNTSTMIDRMNTVVLGMKQCATTGAAAVVVGNNCETMHSLHHIPIITTKEQYTSQETITSKSDNYNKPVPDNLIRQMRQIFAGTGCYLTTIDEVTNKFKLN